MTNNFFRYITMEGDRWDTIAGKHRANPYDYVDIIQNNPIYQGLFILPSGVVISVPVQEFIARRILPPWETQGNL
jgi:hypothetical protein